MVPCGGIYGLNGNDARHVVDQIRPTQFMLPMHIGNARYDDLLPVDEFIDDPDSGTTETNAADCTLGIRAASSRIAVYARTTASPVA